MEVDAQSRRWLVLKNVRTRLRDKMLSDFESPLNFPGFFSSKNTYFDTHKMEPFVLF